ncbi:MAG TPA: 2-oxoacid:ferredoxin oxidoreductase subunit beta [bacterium]|nr:2-oxoacid:ferredoxin oxidoreductase subunit beta [bacterium]
MNHNNIRENQIKPIWCAGCGLHIINSIVDLSMKKLGWNISNTVIISGIGCSGRSSGYHQLDGLHTTHGRAIPVAEGIKLASPDTNIVIFSGDGDLLGIGGNHIIHAARRNTNIKVICNNNQVYAMTGGQLAPTTKTGHITKTSPDGSIYNPINTESLITGNESYFYARTSVINISHLKQSIEESFKWEGFSFVEVISACPTNNRTSIKDLSKEEINHKILTK